MRLKHLLSVFLTLLTLSVGQMWGAYNYTGTGTFTKQSTIDGNGYYVIVLTSSGAMTNSASSNYVGVNTSYNGSASSISNPATSIVLQVTNYDSTNKKYYISNNSGNYLYSSGDKKIAYSATSQYWKIATVSNKTRLMTAQATVVHMGYVANSGFRPYTNSGSNVQEVTAVYKLSATCTNTVSLSAGSATNGTISYASSSVETCGTGDNDRKVTISVAPSSGYTLLDATRPTFNKTSGTATASYVSGPTWNNTTSKFEYVYRFALNDKGAGNFSITCDALPKYKITYNAGTGSCATTSWTQTTAGQSTTLPTATPPATCSGWAFAGWCVTSAGSADENSTSPGEILTGTYQPTSDITLYAVYTRSVNSGGSASLTKMVTGNTLSDGDKLVVVASGDYSDVAMYQETTNSSYVETWDCSTLNATTVGADSKRWWTVTATTGGFYLGDDTNGYLNMSSNNLYCSEDQSVWTLSDLEDGTFKLQSGSRNLSYRHDTQASKWRMGGTSYGNSGQTVLDLYKYSAGGGSTTYYMTSLVCCSPLGSINGSLFRSHLWYKMSL